MRDRFSLPLCVLGLFLTNPIISAKEASITADRVGEAVPHGQGSSDTSEVVKETEKEVAEKPRHKKNQTEELKQKQELLAAENALLDEQVKQATAELRSELGRLRAEKELIEERMALAATKRKSAKDEEIAKVMEERVKLTNESEIAKAKAALYESKLKEEQAKSAIAIAQLQNEIKAITLQDERENYVDATPKYLEKPLQENGILIISDRRIALNGPITMAAADHLTERIHYFNNKDTKYPIFIVIDQSPGGSVMAGYRILKSMESSKAPIHVVVKSFAASMAAGIATLAEESYAFSNTVMLHHQISTTVFGSYNLTQQNELFEESTRWWKRLGTPIAQKMNISTEEFIKKMYEHSTSGDWSEFGDEAQKLKWVNHIISGVEESSFRQNPDFKNKKNDKEKTDHFSTDKAVADLQPGIDENGRPFMFLPRLNPKDVYFLYNPDGYYRLR